MLEKWFVGNDQKQNCFLLRNIINSRGHNSRKSYNLLGMIQVTWCKNYFMATKGTNINKLTDRKIPLWKRLCTFEGPEHLSNKESLNSPLISNKIKLVCESISDHVASITGGIVGITKLSLFFKMDENNELVLLYCTQLQLSSKHNRICDVGSISKKTQSYLTIKKPKRIPNAATFSKEVKMFKGKQKLQCSVPQENCPGCLKISKGGFYPLKLKYVIATLIYGDFKKNIRYFATGGMLDTKDYGLLELGKKDHDIQESNLFPGILKWLFNKHDIQDIFVAYQNPSFLEIEVMLCDGCIVNMTTLAKKTNFDSVDPEFLKRYSEIKNFKSSVRKTLIQNLLKLRARVPLFSLNSLDESCLKSEAESNEEYEEPKEISPNLLFLKKITQNRTINDLEILDLTTPKSSPHPPNHLAVSFQPLSPVHSQPPVAQVSSVKQSDKEEPCRVGLCGGGITLPFSISQAGLPSIAKRTLKQKKKVRRAESQLLVGYRDNTLQSTPSELLSKYNLKSHIHKNLQPKLAKWRSSFWC